jgi:hypothetical protein
MPWNDNGAEEIYPRIIDFDNWMPTFILKLVRFVRNPLGE